MFCVWKINRLCWGITPGTHEEISSSYQNRIARTQTSKHLLSTSKAEGLEGRRSHKKLLMQVSVSRWWKQKQASSQEMGGFGGKGKQKHFLSPSAQCLPELAPSSPGPLHHLSIKFIQKLFNFAPSLIHRGRWSTTTFSYPVNSRGKRDCN